MIPQRFPLYAIDLSDSTAYVVIGWRGWPADTEMIPILAPVDEPGPVVAKFMPLVYGTERPVPKVAPAADETVVMRYPRPIPRPPR